MRSLKWKLVLIYVALVFIVMVISGTFIIVQITNSETDSVREELKGYTEYIYENVLIAGPPERYSETLTQLTKGEQGSSGFQSSILSGDGVTIATNAFLGDSLPAYDNSAVMSAIVGIEKYDKSKRFDAITGLRKDWLGFAKPVEYNGEKYIVYVQTDISPITSKRSKTTNVILLASLMALVISVVIGTIFADTITHPIKDLTKKAKEMARGRLNVNVDVKSHDEIGQLTKNFNYMSVELNNTMSAISSEKNKLETLLNNMTDGVLAFNQYGKVIHANAASKEMLGLDEMYDAFDVVTKTFNVDVTMDDIYAAATPGINESIKSDAVIGKKYITANFAPYTDIKGRPEGVVVVLQDLTDQKALDDMRKEFVANVSHEIRTPLTTIKSYAETLIDGALNDKESAKDFLTTIDSEADRMALLVTDLLQLSSMDNNKLIMNLEVVDLAVLLELNVKQCKILADAKNQTVIYYNPNKEIMTYVDKGRATQVVTNIISNAIKYSPEHSTIKIFIEETKNFFRVIIEDDGMGIPEEDLPRIFERFYRVDKARSREMGGTGLGLAIAKEIMENMGGFIDAESAVGEGTTMYLYFPKMHFRQY